MGSRNVRIHVALLLAAGMTAAARAEDVATEVDALAERLAAQQRTVETLLRRYPSELDLEAERSFVEAIAKQAEVTAALSPAPGGERLALSTGRSSPILLHRVELSGTGRIDALASLLRYVTRGARTRFVESFRVEGSDGRTGAWVARVALPVYAPEERKASGAGSRAAFVAELKKLLADAEALEALLTSMNESAETGTGAVAADVLEVAAERAEIGLTALRAGESMKLEGAIVGAKARAELVSGLGGRGLWVERVKAPAGGACRPFAMTLAREAIEGKVETAGPGSLSKESVALCAEEPRASLGRLAVRGKASGPGAIDLRMRGAEVSHLVLALNALTGEDFVVDRELRATIDADLEGATLAETLAALGTLGVTVSDGPVRLVSRGAARPLAKQGETYEGEAMTFSFDDAPLVELLCLFGNLFGLQMEVAPGLASRVTIHASDVAWDRMLEAMLLASGLDHEVEGTRVFVGPVERLARRSRETWAAACESGAPAQFSDVRPLAAELDPSDLTLAGLVEGEEGWSAYAYGPWRKLVTLGEGQELFRGKVTNVGREGVTLVGASGTVELRLAR